MPSKVPPSAQDRHHAFADALRETLRLRGMRQEDLAQTIGLKQATISGWITGASVPASDVVFAVERALDLRPGALSRHLGYLPVDAVKNVATVRSAIIDDEGLTADQKAMLLAAYESAATPRQRSRRRS